ncbi:MAG: HlyD family efflux transporter periplasmic adaptor subunit [Bacteroidetes bacterium]|nr:HlyD family efflux transporter periplasmic adaptor subunit [Bacteroidota bacterium]
MKKKSILYGIIGLSIIIISFVISGYIIKNKNLPGKKESQKNSVYIKVEKANLKEISSDLKYRGRVTAFDQISLASEVQGKIMQGKVRFKTGENFNKGDVLINIDKEDVEILLKSEKSSFLQILSRILPDIKIDFPNDYEKWNNFFHSIDVEKTLPSLPKIKSDKEKIFLATNNVLSNFYKLQEQQINLESYTIIAPFNGAFKMVNKEIGAISNAGAELATIIRTDKLEITVPIFPSDIKFINKGDNVLIEKSEEDIKIAKISHLAKFVDETNQSVNVYLTYFPKPNDNLLQGEYVDVKFKGVKIKGFEIPREALVNDSYVYVLKEKKIIKTKVEIQRTLNDSYIISGIDEGENVVFESLANINPNIDYLAR